MPAIIYKVDSSGAYTLIAGGGNKVITEDITEDPKAAKLEKAEDRKSVV